MPCQRGRLLQSPKDQITAQQFPQFSEPQMKQEVLNGFKPSPPHPHKLPSPFHESSRRRSRPYQRTQSARAQKSTILKDILRWDARIPRPSVSTILPDGHSSVTAACFGGCVSATHPLQLVARWHLTTTAAARASVTNLPTAGGGVHRNGTLTGKWWRPEKNGGQRRSSAMDTSESKRRAPTTLIRRDSGY